MTAYFCHVSRQACSRSTDEATRPAVDAPRLPYGGANAMSRPGSQKCEAACGGPNRSGRMKWWGVVSETASLWQCVAATRFFARGETVEAKGKWTMSAERPILIVDDDEALRSTLADQLAVDGEFTAVVAASLGEA